MNMAYNLYQAQEFDYTNEDQQGSKSKTDRARRPAYARRNRPVVHNGIHRRRNKRFAW